MLAEKTNIEKRDSIWDLARHALSSHLPGIFFEHFIAPLDYRYDKESAVLYLIGSDQRRIDHIEMKYGELIRKILGNVLPVGFRVELISGSDFKMAPELSSSLNPLPLRTEESAAGLSLAGGPDASVPEFVAETNLKERIRSLCNDSWKGILYIYGPSGAGKSHLARLLSARAKSAFFSMEEFMVSFATASSEGKLLEWKKEIHSKEMVVLDDLQFLRKKAIRTSEQLRSLMDSALQGKIRLVLLADQPVAQIDGGPDLRSRLLEARPLELSFLSGDLRQTLLQQLCNRIGLRLPGGYSAYLAARIKGDHRKLLNAAHRLSVQGDLPEDPAWTETFLEDLMDSSEAIQPEAVLQSVCKFYNVHPDLVCSSARDQSVVRARHLYAFFLHKLSGLKLSEIATILGRKDHSAVLYGIRKTESLFSQDLFLRKQAAALERQIQDGA